jgi:hypothetical protein
MAKTLGPVFVASVGEVSPLILQAAGEIAPGDAVLHQEEGPCVVLARLGDRLMVEMDGLRLAEPAARSG